MSSNQSKASSRDLRITSGIALINNILDQLKISKETTHTLGMGYVEINDKMRRDVQQLQAITLTAGDPIANDLLIKKINKLEYEISAKFPYLPLIRKCMLEVFSAFKLAVGKHYQIYDEIVQKSMVRSLEGISVVDEPEVKFLPNKLKRKKKVVED